MHLLLVFLTAVGDDDSWIGLAPMFLLLICAIGWFPLLLGFRLWDNWIERRERRKAHKLH